MQRLKVASLSGHDGVWSEPDPDGEFVSADEAFEQQATTMEKLAAAWYLANGSFLTAKDFGIRTESSNPVVSDEMKGLAANFLRISELLVEAGFRP